MSADVISALLVEDNPADVALLMKLLQNSDAKSWQITHVKRLKPALEHLHKTEFDVILLDLSLPDSQGLETVIQIQTAFPHLPIIVLTGLKDELFARQAVAHGAQDYLVKGQVSTELLLKSVSYAIERSQILKRLQESEHRFREVFNQTFQFMGLLSPDGVVLDINQVATEISNFQHELVLNHLIWESPCWQSNEKSQSWLQEAVLRASQGETVRSELQALSPRGTSWWFDVSVKPVRNKDGNITLLIAEGRDISKLKRAEAEIRRSLEKERELNQMKNSFIAMVSHEFRNPISAISFGVNFLEGCDLPAEQKARCFERIHRAIDQTLHLLDEILLLGRTESGRVEVEYTRLELKEFCCEIVENFQITQGKSHQIIFVSEGNSSEARTDASLLKHTLDNLLSNAIKYSPKGSVIRFTLTCQGDQAKFCIQDQGIGIPQKDQPKLFEAFHRAANVSGIQGTGLGLAIVKRCVDLQKGQIYFESQERIGTTFTVILPRNLIQIEHKQAVEDYCFQ
ncbi:response regulator [Oscillatoria sp. FACHB-1407]|uniref:sensor histidine kinase n=1 Tax=Oscillatoria sp. FACHB-1407 TaxID=2692847 RepID=UPI00168413AB|nr:ATP-binding protein [Oscillatoria sp. FACHB-1407]MBD2463453.1 response regulator [Oscillatoria sp. FACHB-1407]